MMVAYDKIGNLKYPHHLHFDDLEAPSKGQFMDFVANHDTPHREKHILSGINLQISILNMVWSFH